MDEWLIDEYTEFFICLTNISKLFPLGEALFNSKIIQLKPTLEFISGIQASDTCPKIVLGSYLVWLNEDIKKKRLIISELWFNNNI